MARDPFTQFQRSLQGLRKLKRGRLTRGHSVETAKVGHVKSIKDHEREAKPAVVKPPKVFRNKMLDTINLDWEPSG